MFKNRSFSKRLSLFFFSGFLLVFIPACFLFPPRTLKITVYPKESGYWALVEVSQAKQALLIQDTAPKDLKQFLGDLKTEGTHPEILILATFNPQISKELEGAGILNEIAEFYFPEMDIRPEALVKILEQLEKKRVRSGPLRQSRYIPLRHAEFIVLAPHEYDEYNEATRISFKLIFGRTSFIFAPALDKTLIQTLGKTFGKGALRSDVVVAASAEQDKTSISKLFSSPEMIFTEELESKVPIRFRSNGKSFERLHP